MPKPELGTKRQCANCGAKFFDLGKNPIVCPKCGTVYEVAALPSRARAKPAEDEEPEAETGEAELVPLEEADAGEDEKVAAVLPEEDVEIEEDEAGAEDDTFLEEEEEDSDDVSTLIDGDIEGDEER